MRDFCSNNLDTLAEFQLPGNIMYCVPNSCPVFEQCHEKTGFCICENKGADQLRIKCAADLHLCFPYMDSTIPLPPKSKIASL